MTDHFKGKKAPEHLIDARKKGQKATEQIHGTEMPGSFMAFADTVQECTLLFLLLAASGMFFPTLFIGFIIWKSARSALLADGRHKRLIRLIEEERYEIQNHREQEREELTEMYAAKGLSGDLLKEVIDVLMSDDNKLLQIMLEEELGLSLETHEHPLQHALGAFLGGVLTFSIMYLTKNIGPKGIWIGSFFLFLMSSLLIARLERNSFLERVIPTLALASFAVGVLYIIHYGM